MNPQNIEMLMPTQKYYGGYLTKVGYIVELFIYGGEVKVPKKILFLSICRIKDIFTYVDHLFHIIYKTNKVVKLGVRFRHTTYDFKERSVLSLG